MVTNSFFWQHQVLCISNITIIIIIKITNNDNKNSNNNNNNKVEVKHSSGNGDKPISKQSQIRIKTEILQKTALLGTARVIRTIYYTHRSPFDHYNLLLISKYCHTISFENSKIMIIVNNNNNNSNNNTILRVGLCELTIIPWARVGYEMVNSQRGA